MTQISPSQKPDAGLPVKSSDDTGRKDGEWRHFLGILAAVGVGSLPPILTQMTDSIPVFEFQRALLKYSAICLSSLLALLVYTYREEWREWSIIQPGPLFSPSRMKATVFWAAPIICFIVSLQGLMLYFAQFEGSLQAIFSTQAIGEFRRLAGAEGNFVQISHFIIKNADYQTVPGSFKLLVYYNTFFAGAMGTLSFCVLKK